jgi:glycosyltransferase involved in cell wall biosynthesis
MVKITIITVVFNDEANISTTIQSVITQSYPFIEYIVIDGGSTDGTRTILDLYRQNIDVLISESDNGIYDAMNKGIMHASGDWIHFLNSADFYVDNKAIERMMTNVNQQHLKINIIYTKKVSSIAVNYQDFSYRYLSWKAINHQSVIFSKELFKKKLYNASYQYFADFEHMLDIVPIAKPLKLDIDFVNYNTNGVSSNLNNRSKLWKERALILKQSNLPLYFKIPAFMYSYLAYIYRKQFK